MSTIWSRLINLAGNITGILPVANGGTGLASGTSGGVLGYTATGTLASSSLLAANGVVLGGGAAATPTATAAGTNGQLLVGVTSGAPAFGSTVSAATTFSGGIVFGNGATNINWYEEGTWTPTINASGTAGTVTYSTQNGTYTRIGRRVFYSGTIQWTNWAGSPTGGMQIRGLPYNSNATSPLYDIPSFQFDSINFPAGTVLPGGFHNPGTKVTDLIATLSTGANGASFSVTLNAGATTRGIYFSGSYDV